MSKPAYSILAWLLLAAAEVFIAIGINLQVYVGHVYRAAPRHADAAIGAIVPISGHGDLRYMKQGQFGRLIFYETGAVLCGFACVFAVVIIDRCVFDNKTNRRSRMTLIFPALLAAASVYYWVALA